MGTTMRASVMAALVGAVLAATGVARAQAPERPAEPAPPARAPETADERMERLEEELARTRARLEALESRQGAAPATPGSSTATSKPVGGPSAAAQGEAFEKKFGEDAVIPKERFDPIAGGWGAWQVALRWDYLHADSSVRRDLGGSGADIVNGLVAGFNWYLNSLVKIQFNYNRNLFNHDAAYTGRDTEDVFMARFEVEF